MSFVAPAGTPVLLRDIARAAISGASDPSVASRLSAALGDVSGLPGAWPVSSGRAGMTLILRAMRNAAVERNRSEVIIPAYTCYSVPAAIERAGLQPRLCDVNPLTLGIDPADLRRSDFSRVLAVASANLYGVPDDLGAIEAICRERRVYMLDDAAQALGAMVSGRSVGSFGDAGIYSFDKGKIISTMQGGAIVSRSSEVANELAALMENLPPAGICERLSNPFKLAIYSIFLRPRLYPIIRALPFTGLGHTTYDTQFPITRLAATSSALAALLLARLDKLSAIRRRNAADLQAALERAPGIETIPTPPGSIAAFARFPILVSDAIRRHRLIAALQRAGIGASPSYPKALCDVPEVRARLVECSMEFPGARKIAATIVTLPTHPYCPLDVAARVQRVVQACAI